MTPREEARDRCIEAMALSLGGSEEGWGNETHAYIKLQRRYASDLLDALLACREDVLAVLGLERMDYAKWRDTPFNENDAAVFRFASEGSQDEQHGR